MHVSMKADYGVRAMVDLAQHQGEGPVQTAEIAARQSVPEPYLDQILTTLNKYGFIRSRRGPQGGHLLAAPPEKIALQAVITTLEGHLAPLECLNEPTVCTLSSACSQREVWRSVEEAVQSVLSSTSIADLANRQRELTSYGMYHI
ncbi:MAG: Rrf2 family transcriptional regulator [Chloroflexi bacterium]|nr:Rrf2 family transcriptional regulator [Chloroflexota bacterium]